MSSYTTERVVGGSTEELIFGPYYVPCICPPLPPPAPIPFAPPNPLAALGPGTVDFGQDFNFLNQLDPNFGMVSGLANLGQALAHRLETPRGGLFYDPDYGTDIRGLLNDTMTPASLSRLAADVNAECLKDERVLSCISSVQFLQATGTLGVVLNVTTASGRFTFVLPVTDDVNVTLLDSTAGT